MWRESEKGREIFTQPPPPLPPPSSLACFPACHPEKQCAFSTFLVYEYMRAFCSPTHSLSLYNIVLYVSFYLHKVKFPSSRANKNGGERMSEWETGVCMRGALSLFTPSQGGKKIIFPTLIIIAFSSGGERSKVESERSRKFSLCESIALDVWIFILIIHNSVVWTCLTAVLDAYITLAQAAMPLELLFHFDNFPHSRNSDSEIFVKEIFFPPYANTHAHTHTRKRALFNRQRMMFLASSTPIPRVSFSFQWRKYNYSQKKREKISFSSFPFFLPPRAFLSSYHYAKYKNNNKGEKWMGRSDKAGERDEEKNMVIWQMLNAMCTYAPLHSSPFFFFFCSHI